MQRPGDQPPTTLRKLRRTPSGDPRAGSPDSAEAGLAVMEWNGYLLTRSRCTLKRDLAFGNSTHGLS